MTRGRLQEYKGPEYWESDHELAHGIIVIHDTDEKDGEERTGQISLDANAYADMRRLRVVASHQYFDYLPVP